MPINISIKNVPDATADRLRARAKQNHRSLQGELLSVLEQAVNNTPIKTARDLQSERHPGALSTMAPANRPLAGPAFATDLIRTEIHGPVATVILNRPEKLNALNLEMWAGVGGAFQALDENTEIRCIILRGAGDKAVGPGADITEFADKRNNSEQGADYGGVMHASMAAIRGCRHPVIARIRGLCVGGALELALMCDLRIAGQGARFGVPINKLGLVMAHPETAALVGLVGPSLALEILYEARVFGAAEALAKGLVNRVVADEAVDTEISETAARICAGAPLVNRWHKKFVYEAASGKPPSDASEGFACFDTVDFQEGLRAFLAKETPDFKGK